MSYRIWKYPLEITDRQHITLPAGMQCLSVLVARPYEDTPNFKRLFLYAFVDPDQPTITITIRIIGTGDSIDAAPAGEFLGTVVMPPHVWHVFKE